MNYSKEVREARALVGRSESDQWALAERTYRVCVDGGADRKKWAADIGVSPRTIGRWVQVWRRFSNPKSRPKDSTFNSCVELAAVSEETAAEMLAEAREAGVSVKTIRNRTNLAAARAAERLAEETAQEAITSSSSIVDAALKDPNVIEHGEQIARDRATMRRLDRQDREAGHRSTGGLRKGVGNVGIRLGRPDLTLKALSEDITRFVEADAEFPVEMLHDIRRYMADIATELEVYAARHDLNVRFVNTKGARK